jgi:hypothetical protein
MKLSLKNAYFAINESESLMTGKKDERKPKKKTLLSLENVFGFSKQNALSVLKENEESASMELSPEDELAMKSLAVSIDKIIDSTVSLEEKSSPPMSSTAEETMATGQKGFDYEKTVINALKKAKASGNISTGAGACTSCSDADMNIYGDIFNLEVKLNSKAQMGGGSLRFKNENDISFSQEDMEDSTKKMLEVAVKNNSGKIKKLLNFLKQQEPKAINSKSFGFPGTWTKDAWLKANKAGLLFNFNKAASVTVDHLADHYEKKGVYYIQIGGAGLFYLSKNPANLPVPKLEGEMNIEMGTRPGGSKELSNGIRVVGAGIRVQGRLKTTNKSPYTLDDPLSIQKLLAAVKTKKKTSSKKSGPKQRQQAPETEPGDGREIPVDGSLARHLMT